uniref:Apple domain-containing protein n=1 Tax=Anisakis simplex TaxID=6269 RepID=A0A0M3KAT5_ANISI
LKYENFQPDSKVGSEKWSVPKESEDSAKRVESFFSDDNDNDNNYNYYNNRNDDQNNNNNNENAPEIMLLNENGEYIRSFESKPDLATHNYHSKMEQDESKGKSYESDEPKIESSLDDLSIPLPSMQVVSMKLTKHVDENVNNDNIPSAACGKNDVDVWISIENAIFNSMSAQKLSYAHSAHACKQKCNTITNAGRECPAVTYHEMEHECIAYTNNIQSILALRIKPSSTNNFNTRTLLKFLDLQAFNGCSEFTSFPDYTLDVKPREQFDGMPTGYEGLKACIELCVLSPNFYCKSASFRYTEGRCLLRDDNSMTKPEAFHEHSPLNDEIYFENGCEQILTIDNQQDSSEHAQMVRISSTEGDYSK